MPFEIPADPGDPGRPRTGVGRVDGGRAGGHHRLVRDGAQVLAHGALICPECALPIAVSAPFSAGMELVCGYCDHAARGHDFIARDVFDTLANEVHLVARVGRAAPSPS
jgi:hypothetical protein